MIKRRSIASAALGLLGGATTATAIIGRAPKAQAQEAATAFPSRAVSVVVPWAAGGSTDAFMRVLGARLSTDLGRPFVIDNRTGASGTIGMASAVRARPDGYTVIVAPNSTYAIAPSLYQLQYDTARDFVGVGLLATMPIFALVPRNSPVRSIADYIARVKQPGHREVYANPGSGSTPHLAAEMFLQLAGIEVPDVGYRGGAPAVLGVLAGEAGFIFQPVSSVISHMQSGDLRPLAVASLQRSPVAPDVPTFAELGFPGFEVMEHIAMLAPAGTPPAILARLNAASKAAMDVPEVRERMATLGVTPDVRPPEAWPAYLTAETAKWREVIRSRNIRLQ